MQTFLAEQKIKEPGQLLQLIFTAGEQHMPAPDSELFCFALSYEYT